MAVGDLSSTKGHHRHKCRLYFKEACVIMNGINDKGIGDIWLDVATYRINSILDR